MVYTDIERRLNILYDDSVNHKKMILRIIDALNGNFWMSTKKLIEAFNILSKYHTDFTKEIALTIFRKAYSDSGLTYDQICERAQMHKPLVSKILDAPQKCELDSILRFAKAISMDEEKAKSEWAEIKKQAYQEKIDAEIKTTG